MLNVSTILQKHNYLASNSYTKWNARPFQITEWLKFIY